MAAIETEQIHSLYLNDDELELIANILYSGPRLGHGYFSDVAYHLADVIDSVRGEVQYEDRLFDPGDEDGFIWVRHDSLS